MFLAIDIYFGVRFINLEMNLLTEMQLEYWRKFNFEALVPLASHSKLL
jgi:hypothetical protein